MIEHLKATDSGEYEHVYEGMCRQAVQSPGLKAKNKSVTPQSHLISMPATYVTWIALVFVCSFAVFAQGGPPLLTDDPGTPGNRNWEINIASTQFFSPGENEIETPLLDINYGLGDRIQLKYEVPYLLDQDKGGPYRSGLGNSLLGVKWRFYQQNGWDISTYPRSR